MKRLFSSSSRLTYFRELVINSRYAEKLMNSGKTIAAQDVNKFLSFANIKITQAKLDKMLSIKRLEFNNLTNNTIRSKYYLDNIGTYRGKIQIPGVYIWTHLSTGDKYVGSSSKLARRLQGYFHDTHKSVGKFIPLLKLEGLDKFKLEVIPLTDIYSRNLEICLEQYFLLNKEYNLNTLRLVSGFSGNRSQDLFLYNHDCSKLLYHSDVKEDFIFKLGVHHSTFTKCIDKGELYLGKFLFSDKPILTAIDSELSIDEVLNLLDLERAKIKDIKGRGITIRSTDNNETLHFNTISSCIDYLNEIAPSNKTSLYRHIKLGKSYQGYICEFDNKKSLALVRNSIEVVVTHVPTNETNTYDSLRKAALSFGPEIKTTGQTLSAYANKDKLFSGEYKIETKDKINENKDCLEVSVYKSEQKLSNTEYLFFLFMLTMCFGVSIVLGSDEETDNNDLEIEDGNSMNQTEKSNDIDPEPEIFVKEKRLLDYDPDDKSDYFPDNSDYYAKIDKQNEADRKAMELVQRKAHNEYYAYTSNDVEASTNEKISNTNVVKGSFLLGSAMTENTAPDSSYKNQSISPTDTEKVREIRSGVEVAFTPSTAASSSSINNQDFNNTTASPSLPPAPENTPVNANPPIIVTRPVAEGEPKPPLPSWTKISPDNEDYPIKHRLLKNMEKHECGYIDDDSNEANDKGKESSNFDKSSEGKNDVNDQSG